METKKISPEEERRLAAEKTLYITLAVNGVLMVFKLFAGIVGSSGAMVSDAMHTLSDLGTTVIAIFGVRFASKKRDEMHPYGHERIESVVSLLLACALFATALLIGSRGIEALGAKNAAAVPSGIALVAAVASIVTQECMYRLARHTGKKVNSPALIADAWHHRSDAMSSVGALIGIGAAKMGYWFMDPAVSLIICILILKAAYTIGKNSIIELIDESAPQEKVEKMRNSVMAIDGVLHIDRLRTRIYSNRLYADIEIAVHHDMSFEEAHIVSERVHRMIEKEYPEVIHCTVHANPHHIDGREVRVIL